MKIIFIAIKGIDKIGGIETYTRELGKRLAKSGHEVIVYTLKNDQRSATYEYKGMTIIPLPSLKSRFLQKMSLVFLASLHQFKHKDVDIIHYHAIGPSLFCFIPRITGRKTCVQSHGHEWKWKRSNWSQLEETFFNFAERFSFKYTSTITAVSKELKNYYQSKYNQHVKYIPNGVNTASHTPAKQILEMGLETDNYILFLGRISREKGIHYLINAYQNINTTMKLVIVGQQREGDTYITKLQKLADNNPQIIFPGAATGNLWNEFYSNAAISVLPSETEGLPIALLEAMSFGNCCLVSDITANKEALGDTGLTFKSQNSESLQKALESLISNPDKRATLGQLAKQRISDNYTWKKISTEVERFYLETIGMSQSNVQLIEEEAAQQTATNTTPHQKHQEI